MAKKTFGKRFVALLATLALLISMVAMVGSFAVSAESSYTPKRAVTFTTSEGIQQSTFMLQDAWKVAGGKEVTVKGYYKVDSITGTKFELMGGAVVATEATDGWVEFAIPYTVPSAAEWKSFGFWEASGTFALADITFEDAEGNVLYDLATDKDLPAGTYTGWAQHSIWYILGNYGTCADGSSCTVVIDDVYTPPYNPKRAVTFTTSEGIQQSTFMLQDAWKVAGGKEVTVKGYYKVDSITGTKFELMGGAVVATEATDGWVEFAIPYTVPSAAEWKSFGFWEASGTFALADITFEDAEGNVLYDLATDKDLPAGTYTGWAQHSIWYILGNYGTCADGSSCTVVIDEVYEDGTGGTVIPPNIGAVDVPAIPDLLAADSTGYAPNRAFAIISTVDENPKALYAVWGDNYLASNKYYVFANIKVTGFSAFEGAEEAYSYFQLEAGTQEPVLCTWTADTDGWVQLLGADGKPVSFDKLASADDSLVLTFANLNASANLIVGDLIIADAEGNIVYSLANDKSLNMVSDVRYTSSADWQADPYVSTPEGPTLFPVRTKGNAEYVPNVSLTIAPEKGKVGSVAENSIIIRSNAAPFVAGETYTISGKVNVDVTGGYNGHANPRMDFTAHTLGPIGSAYVADTDGWVSLVYSNGEPITFKGTADLDYIKFNLYCTHGSLSLADIVIRDSQGNVVYDMAKDEGLLAATEPITNEGWFDLGEIWRIALYGEEFSSCVVTVNENPVDHTDADYEVPEFEETVEVPSNEVEEEEDVIPPTDGMSILLLAALSVMSAGGAAVLSLKKKEN